MKLHKFCELIPEMSDEDFSMLRADIKKNGLITPIVTYEGQILDGRNRHKICKELNIEPETVEYDGNDPLGYVISLNEARRHLTKSQRAMLAANIANMKSGSRTDLEPTANLQEVSISDAAKKHNVSERMVSAANKLSKEAPPAVIKDVQDGKLTINAAQKIVDSTKDESPAPAPQSPVVDNSVEAVIARLVNLVSQIEQEFKLLSEIKKTEDMVKSFKDLKGKLDSIELLNPFVFDGTTPINPAVARLICCSEKSSATITGVIKKAKKKLKIDGKSTVSAQKQRLRIYRHIAKNIKDYKTIPWRGPNRPLTENSNDANK